MMTALGLGLDAARPAPVRSLAGEDDKTKLFFGRLVEYIPGDVVGGYVVVSALVPKNARWNWPEWTTGVGFLLVGLLLVVAPVIRQYRLDNNKAFPKWRDYPRFRMFVVSVAYVAWIFALPGSPFEPPGWLQSLVLTIVTSGLAGLALIFDLGKSDDVDDPDDAVLIGTPPDDGTSAVDRVS